MKRFGVIIGLVALLAACSSSEPPAEDSAGEGSKLTRKEAKALVEEMLNASEFSTYTPSLHHDQPCIEATNAVIIDEAGQAALSPDAVGLFKSVINDDDGFHFEYVYPLTWEATIENLWELSPGVIEVSYSAKVANPPLHLAVWFEACASESDTEKLKLSDQGTRNAELSEDGEWRFQPQSG